MTTRVVEKAVLLGPDRDQVAIVSVPERPRGLGLLLMNAGLIHRVGPNRLNVELARAAARAGYTAIRLDLAGFGDSPSRAQGLGFEDGAVRDLELAMTWLSETHGVERFVSAGLCSGADVSLELAARLQNVAAAVLVDCFSYDTGLSFVRGYAQRAISRRSWKGFVGGGQSDLRELCIAKVKGALGRGEPGTEVPETSRWVQPPRERIRALVDAATDNGTRLHLVYSGGPAYDNYLLNLRDVFGPHLKSGRADLVRFKESDHTFTMAYDRARLVEDIVDWMGGLDALNRARASG